jgi:methyl-accepting chemotaxis protein
MKLKQRLSLQQKILVMVIGASIIIYAIAIGYISIKSRNTALNQAISLTNTYADTYASDIKFLLEEDLIAVRTLSRTALTFRSMPEKQWKELFAKMYEKVISDNPQFLSIWDSWELNKFDPTYKKDYGRYVCEFWRENGKINQNASLKDLTGDALEYGRIKRDKDESLENPYFYSYSGNVKDQLLMTSIIVPILENNDFIGVIGVDISLSRYHPIINQIKPFKGSYAFLVANDLQYVAHPSIEKIGASVTDDYDALFTRNSIVDKIVNGEPASFFDNDINGTNSFFTFKPIMVGKTVRPWSLVVVVPKSVILEEANRNFIISIVVGILGLLILSTLFFYIFQQYIITPIQIITKTLKRLANGHIDSEMALKYDQGDEIGQMASALNTSIEGFTHKTTFAYNIGQGNLETELRLLSDEDILGKSLIHMQESLKKAKLEESARKLEDEKRQWSNAGLATFSDILRQNNDKLDVLAADIIKNLVKYIDANQGGLFIFNDDDPEYLHFELLSTFAFNRHKFIKKQILLGEGLVGTCALEKKTIYLTEIPENYIQITSGLGEARPRCLLIVPLLLEDKVLGILEIASFAEIEGYKIDFVEKLAISVASTLTSVRTNIKTSMLLSKTQQQAEEMSAQEEEMRQNMEELQATQEESSRKEVEMRGVFNALRSSLFIAELDLDGKIIEINSYYADVFGKSQEILAGQNIKDLFGMGGVSIEENTHIWKTLNSNQIVNTTTHLQFNDNETWLNHIFAPIVNNEGAIIKILNIAFNITETKRNESEIKTEREKLKLEEVMFMSLMNFIPDRITFKDKNSVYLRVNKAKAHALKLNNPNDVIGKTDFDYFEKDHAEHSLRAEKELFEKNKNITEKEKKIHLPDGSDSWIINNRIIMRDEVGEVIGGLVITQDITNFKNLTFELDNLKTLLKTLSEKISLIVYEIDKNGLIINAFGKGLEIVHKKPSVFIGKSFESVSQEAANMHKKNKGNIVRITTTELINKQQIEIEHIFFVNEF